MNRTRFALALAMLLFSVTVALAQNSVPKRKFNHKVKIETSYDKFKDISSVETDYMKVFRGRQHYVSLAAGFRYTGFSLTTPRYVILFIGSESKEWKYLNPPDMLVIADGQRLNLGTMKRVDSDIRTFRGAGTALFEYLSLAIPYESYLQVVNSRTVEMQIGEAEFALKEEHHEALRDLASRMVP